MWRFVRPYLSPFPKGERAGILHMHGHYTAHSRELIERVLNSPGETNSDLRRAVEAQAAKLSGRISTQRELLPQELERYITKVALYAYKITDQDIEALNTAGYSEDAIFELTLSAALGAGMARLEQGLKALQGEGDETQNH